MITPVTPPAPAPAPPAPPVAPVTPLPAPAPPQDLQKVLEDPAFYITVASYVLPLLSLLFHKDYTHAAITISNIAPIIVTVFFFAKRAYEQATHTKAVATYQVALLNITHLVNQQTRTMNMARGNVSVGGPFIEERLERVKNEIINAFKSHTLQTPPREGVSGSFAGTSTSNTLRIPVSVAPAPAPAAKTTSGVEGRKADGSIDMRTKAGRVLKAAEQTATAVQAAVPAKKAVGRPRKAS